MDMHTVGSTPPLVISAVSHTQMAAKILSLLLILSNLPAVTLMLDIVTYYRRKTIAVLRCRIQYNQLNY